MDSMQAGMIWLTIGTIVATTSFVWETCYAPYTDDTSKLLVRVLPMWALVTAMLLAMTLWPITLVMALYAAWRHYRRSGQ